AAVEYPITTRCGTSLGLTSMLVKPSVTSITSVCDGKRHDELASMPGSGARRRHAAAVQLHVIAHHGEAVAESRSGSRLGGIRLFEEIEYVWQSLRRDADPGVLNTNDGVRRARLHRHRQLTAGVGVP